jgi:hypothetical protein
MKSINETILEKNELAQKVAQLVYEFNKSNPGTCIDAIDMRIWGVRFSTL